MSIRTRVRQWPVLRQLTTADHLGRGTAVRSAHTEELTPRTRTADRMVQSVCPYCAVGCGQRVYVKGERVIQIEGDPDSPISRGRLCPKGSASEQLVNGPGRVTTVKYRRPFGTDWEDLPLERAMEMIADRVLETRAGPGRTRTKRAIPCTGRSASPALVVRPSTTKRTTSSRSSSPPSELCRSRTRPVFDTAPLSPVWGPRSDAAEPRPSSRTCRTLTASSSRARTWPSAIRWASSG